jgi:hypothetical protein
MLTSNLIKNHCSFIAGNALNASSNTTNQCQNIIAFVENI